MTTEPTEAAAVRARALRSASAAYSARHGDPLDHGAASRMRWATSTTAAVAVAGAVLAVTLVVVLRSVLGAPPTVVPAPPVTPAAVATAPAPAVAGGPGTSGAVGTPEVGGAHRVAGPTEGPLVVHVVGRVARPGVVTLPAGSRVVDALDAAGGATPEADLAALNLARLLVDGEQVHVTAPGEEVTVPTAPSVVGPPGSSAAPAGGGRGTATAGPLDLNRASATELEALPGIGPVLAARVVEHRDVHGPFPDVAALAAVPGIGPAVLAGLADLVTVR